MGMLQMPEQTFRIGGEAFTVAAIAAAELYGNTEEHSWGKDTKGGLVTPGVFSFSNSVNKIEPWFNYSHRNMQTFGLGAMSACRVRSERIEFSLRRCSCVSLVWK